MMAFIPAWAWRWIAVAAVGVALFGTGWIKGRAGEAEKFDEYKAQVKAASDRQNQLTQQTIAAHQRLREMSDVEANAAVLTRDAALARVRLLVRDAGSRIVPAPSTGATGSNRVCFAADELDRGIREALDRVTDRTLAIAQEGQRGIDTAVVCREWTNALK